MMDADGNQIPQPGHPRRNRPSVDTHSPTLMVAVVSEVLNDDNLLIEILLRVAFPTTLVRAALVCKRWFRHASDRRFLGRFRKLHPPRLLGFYVVWEGARFIAMRPQPPELASVARQVASYSFGKFFDFEDCRNGTVLTRDHEQRVWRYKANCPLRPERSMSIIVPPVPRAQGSNARILAEFLSREEGNNLSYFYMLAEIARETKNVMVRVFILQGGVWCMLASATNQLHYPRPRPKPLLVDNKIYMMATRSDNIFVLDLTGSSFSTLHLPQGVEYASSEIMFSRADDPSGVYLIHVSPKEFQLCIWLHKGDDWLLVDTFYLHEMRAILGTTDHAHVNIRQVGDNAQFVFLQTSRYIFYLHIKCRTLRKVYEVAVNGQCLRAIHPFMMIWPPIFPSLKDDPERNAT